VPYLDALRGGGRGPARAGAVPRGCRRTGGRAEGALIKFGDRLRELRDRAGLTQQQLARKAIVALATLRGLERRQRRPSWNSVVKLARALGVSADAFADCDEVKEGPRHGPRGQKKGE
jgi:DNA-binding XRE family transcriptional regulator